MACCTTISPLNSGQKRSSGGLFDLPHSAKRRRPMSTTTLTTAATSSSSVIIDANAEKNTSVFQTTKLPFSGFIVESSNNLSNNTNINSVNLPQHQYQSQHIDSEDHYKNDLMERIKHEAKRLIKRKQMSIGATITTSSSDLLNNHNLTSPPSSPKSSLSSSQSESKSTPTTSISNLTKTSNNNINHNDLPIFSMNQVNLICDRMLKEREQFIREQYDKILAQKLSEQYDAFVKFTHEQIQRRFENSQCSYVS
jgi:hypothetical protein